MPNTPEFIISFYGAIKIGAVPVPLNTMSNENEYLYFLKDNRSKVLVVQKSIWEKIKNIQPYLEYLKHIIIVDDNNKDNSGFNERIKNYSDTLNAAETDKDDSAFWLYSSGSTNKPKAIIHHQNSMLYSINNYAKEILKLTDSDTILSAAKLFFAYGLGNSAFFGLGTGAKTVLMHDRPLPEKILKTINKYKVTVFFGVPSVFLSIINYVKHSEKEFDLSSLRICVSAGEHLTQHIHQEWLDLFNVSIINGVGSTELAHIYISNRIDDIEHGCLGKIVPGYDAKIVNEEGKECDINEIGDLLIKGGSVASSFWNNVELSKKHYIGEWFFTGDKVLRDENNAFWYFGRTDDMIKVGGKWFSPLEIENILSTHKLVQEVAIVLDINKENFLQVKAFIVPEDRDKILDSNINFPEYVKQYIKGKDNFWIYKARSWKIEFVSELPKTPTGKIQRYKFRNEFYK